MTRTAALIFTLVLTLWATAFTLTADASAHERRCLEDQPCWSWSTMGNLSRGVFVHGRKSVRVVEPCRFAALDFHGKIDWTRTPRLKGDGFARKHGCSPYLYA